jgi:putative protein-disulfide isomerase
MTRLLYIADPMCSWCYGFGPELTKFINAIPDASVDILAGGLRAYNKQILDNDQRDMILSHWDKVEQVSGLPFDASALSSPQFIYDTEPACRAVVAAKLLAEDMPSMAILAVFHALQHAFYAQAKDITKLDILAQVAVQALNQFDGSDAFDEESFLETLQAPMTMDETRQHFEQIQRWGVRGYPALLLVKTEGLHMLTSGYVKCEQLLSAYHEISSDIK